MHILTADYVAVSAKPGTGKCYFRALSARAREAFRGFGADENGVFSMPEGLLEDTFSQLGALGLKDCVIG